MRLLLACLALTTLAARAADPAADPARAASSPACFRPPDSRALPPNLGPSPGASSFTVFPASVSPSSPTEKYPGPALTASPAPAILYPSPPTPFSKPPPSAKPSPPSASSPSSIPASSPSTPTSTPPSSPGKFLPLPFLPLRPRPASPPSPSRSVGSSVTLPVLASPISMATPPTPLAPHSFKFSMAPHPPLRARSASIFRPAPIGATRAAATRSLNSSPSMYPEKPFTHSCALASSPQPA